MYTYTYVGQQCRELIPYVEGSEIKNCTSNITGFGLQGDTCIVTYSNRIWQVNELWSCQENAQWRNISGIIINITVLTIIIMGECKFN